MSEADRLSQASSVATVSSLPAGSKASVSKVHSFGKRGLSVKRDPNCPVIIRGWLYKQDSSGLKLWKRRWFVLSDYCLFYYRDSREETVLGSIPLPSYSILLCTQKESKNRKFAFKAAHAGMRSYMFSADTQEDMVGWIRAMTQCASLESDPSGATLNRRCSSFQDFTQLGGSSYSLDLSQHPPLRNGSTPVSIPGSKTQTVPSQPATERGGCPEAELKKPQKSTGHERDKQSRHQSPCRSRKEGTSTLASVPAVLGSLEVRGRSYSQELEEAPPLPVRSLGSRPLTPRGQLGSRPHTPVGRVDVRPQGDIGVSPARPLTPLSMGSAPPSPQPSGSTRGQPEVNPAFMNPSLDRRHAPHRPSAAFTTRHPPAPRRPAGKGWCVGGLSGLLPPLPPPRSAPSHRGRLTVCLPAPAHSVLPATSDLYQETEHQPIRGPESKADAVLTRLCGCDKLLQSLAIEMAQLRADKDSLQCALEMTRLQLEEWGGQEGVRGPEGVISQQAVLQEELVQTRARICDVATEMDKVWGQYEQLESELSVLCSHLEHICRYGRLQEQSRAQREIWMIEDILCGLSPNKNNFQLAMGSSRQTGHHRDQELQLPGMTTPSSAVLHRPVLHPGAPVPSGFAAPAPDWLQSGVSMDEDLDTPPPRPPLPQEHHRANQNREAGLGWLDSESESEPVSPQWPAKSPSVFPTESSAADTQTAYSAPCWPSRDSASKVGPRKVRMSPEEQQERMRRHLERPANQRRAPVPLPANHGQGQGSPPPREQVLGRDADPLSPQRVTRVVTGLLPCTLVARRVSVEDPPPELPEQLATEAPEPGLGVRGPQPGPSAGAPERKSHQTLGEEPGRQLASRYAGGALQAEPSPTPLRSPPPKEAAQPPPDQEAFRTPNSELQSGGTFERSFGQEETGLVLTGGMLGNGRRDAERRREKGASPPKAVIHAPFLTSDLDLDPERYLTPEQQEARERRAERIRERVIRSAVQDCCGHAHPPPLEGDRERLISLSFRLALEASQKSREMAARWAMDTPGDQGDGGTWGLDSERAAYGTWADLGVPQAAPRLPPLPGGEPPDEEPRRAARRPSDGGSEEDAGRTDTGSPRPPSGPPARGVTGTAEETAPPLGAGLSAVAASWSSEPSLPTHALAPRGEEPPHNAPGPGSAGDVIPDGQDSPANRASAGAASANRGAPPSSCSPWTGSAALPCEPGPPGDPGGPEPPPPPPPAAGWGDERANSADRLCPGTRRSSGAVSPVPTAAAANQNWGRDATSPGRGDSPANREAGSPASNQNPGVGPSANGVAASGSAVNEIHIYEEITYHVFNARSRGSSPGRSPPGGRTREEDSRLPDSAGGQHEEGGTGPFQQRDWSALGAPANQPQPDRETANGSLQHQAGAGQADTAFGGEGGEQAGKELASPDSGFGESASNQSSPFAEGRLTVLRTSL